MRVDTTFVAYGKRAIVMLVCGWFSSNCFAQMLPISPYSPTSARQCQAFSAEVQAYEASYSQQHESCLAQHPADRAAETSDSRMCSRSSCQYLHDQLFGNSMFSVKNLNAQVAACMDKVAQHDQEDAQARASQAQRDADRDKREAERRQSDNERSARRQREKDAEAARDNQASIESASRELRDAAQSVNDQRAAADRYAQVRSAVASSPPSISKLRSSGLGAHTTTDPNLKIVDPFGSDKTTRRASELPTNTGIVDPFKTGPALVDPFATSPNPHLAASAPDASKLTYEASAKIINESSTRVIDVLQGDIQRIQDQAGKTISQAKAAEWSSEIRDAQGVVRGVGRILSGGQYALLVKNIVSAESSEKKDEATGDAIKQIASDLIRRDAVTNGMTAVSLRLFGERIGPMLVRAATPAMAAGGIIFDSEKIGRDPVAVIHDTTGKVSLSEKQSALMTEWRGYQRVQEQTSNAANPGRQRSLWIDSNIVYNQCLEVKGTCDKWKIILDQK